MIRDFSAAWLSRAPWHSGQVRGRRYGATAFCTRWDSVLMSRRMYARSNFSSTPTYEAFITLSPMGSLYLRSLPHRSRSISSGVKSRSFLSLSKKPDAVYAPTSQLTNTGTWIAPSLSDLSRSRKSSATTATLRPSPLHSGHMPAGSLNENAFA